MLELDLSNLSLAELEKIITCHCAQFGRVTMVNVERGYKPGSLVVLLRMSGDAELERVRAALGGQKSGDCLIIHVAHEACAMAAAPACAPHRARQVNILLVEDNPADVWMTREALHRLSAHYQLHIVGDGQEAIDFLYREGRFAGAPMPDLVLLDLNLPKLSGHEVLFKIKSSGRLKHIPVVVLTSSSAPSDVRRSYQRNADCFVTKAAGLEAYAREIKVVEALLPH